MTLGEYIMEYRTKHNMSTRTFAALCGISRPYIGILERGMNPSTNQPAIPSKDTVQRIAAATGISFEDLVARLSEDGAVPYVEKPSVRRPHKKDISPKKPKPKKAKKKDEEPVSLALAPLTQDVISKQYISPIVTDINTALLTVARRYGVMISCVPNPVSNGSEGIFMLRVTPDTGNGEKIKSMCSLPLSEYHDSDVSWRSTYAELGDLMLDKHDWDSVCHLIGFKPDDFCREVDCGIQGVLRITRADVAIVRHGKAPRVHIRARNVRTGIEKWYPANVLKTYMPDYQHLPCANFAQEDYYELGEWLYWMNILAVENEESAKIYLGLLDAYHKVIHLDQSDYEIAGFARLANRNPIILRSLRRKGLRRISCETALEALKIVYGHS